MGGNSSTCGREACQSSTYGHAHRRSQWAPSLNARGRRRCACFRMYTRTYDRIQARRKKICQSPSSFMRFIHRSADFSSIVEESRDVWLRNADWRTGSVARVLKHNGVFSSCVNFARTLRIASYFDGRGETASQSMATQHDCSVKVSLR